MDPAARLKAGLADGLIRLSVGIVALEVLRADLEAALERAAGARPHLREALAAAC
jgi:cystathionine beta-lyase/cystathionine gamma-synthase